MLESHYVLRKNLWTSKVTCDDGWTVSPHSSSGRVDSLVYADKEWQLEVSGEGGGGQMDIFFDPKDTGWKELSAENRLEILRRMAAALSLMGFRIDFWQRVEELRKLVTYDV